MCSWHPPVRKTKKGATSFQTPLYGKRMDDHPSKVPPFVGHGFSRERENKPHFKFHTNNVVLLIYQMMSRMLGLSGLMTDFEAAGISRYFWVSCSVQRSIQHRYALILVSFDRYAFHPALCEI
jgi:hypothetical protein